MRTAVSIGSFFLVVILVALTVGLIAILVQFTHNLPHGYARTFLMTTEIAVVVFSIVYAFSKLPE